MKKTLTLLLAALLVILLAFTGCSKASVGYSGSPAENYMPSGPDYNGKDYSLSNGDAIPPSEEAGNQFSYGGRKVIRNAELTVQTLEFDQFIASILGKTAELNGYVESNYTKSRGYGYTNMRFASIVLRIPADRLDEFLSAVDGLGNVIDSNEKVSDVTEQYVDYEAKLSSLRTEYDVLLGLLEKATSLDEIITLQDRLTSVRYQIESYESKIRTFDSLIQYSTVTLTVNEVERETTVEDESFGQEVSRRFSESLEDVGEGFKDFAAWFIGNLPIIVVVLLIFVGIPLFIVLMIIHASKRRKEKKRAKEQAEIKTEKI